MHRLVAVLVVACGTVLFGQSPATPVPGAVSGVVVDAATGAPLPDAYVQLQALFGGGGGAQPRKTTDAKGRFIFAPVPAVDGYLLTVTRAGYLDGGFHRAPTDEAGALFALREGQWRNDLTIRLWKTASISGTVLDDRGQPMVEVMVHLAQRARVGPADGWIQMNTVTTDDRGAYRFGRLPPGDYVAHAQPLHVTLPKDATSVGSRRASASVSRAPDGTGNVLHGPLPPAGGGRVYIGGFHPTGQTVEQARVITLEAGDEHVGADIQMALRSTVPVSGRVVGPPQAIAGLPLRLVPSGATAAVPSSDLGITQTDAAGAFTFAQVPEGDFLLVAGRSISRLTNPNGMALAQWPPADVMTFTSTSLQALGNGLRATTYGVAGPDATAELPVSVGTSPVTDLIVPLTPSVSISGEFRFGPEDRPQGGMLTGAQFFPIDGPAGRAAVRGRMQRLEDTATGPVPFSVDNVRAGRYLLATAFMSGVGVRAAEWNGRNLFEVPLEVEAGVPVSGVVITLGRLDNLVGGTVVTSGPPADLAVMVFPESQALWPHSSTLLPQFQTAFVGRAGTWQLRNLPPGRYLAAVVPVEQRRAIFRPGALQALSADAARFTIDVGSKVSVSLTYRGER
ncbi:MAG: hypothetical protein AMXMBFR57_35520 [Acidimicrobiia bacterium]|jgi:hypothetical protein